MTRVAAERAQVESGAKGEKSSGRELAHGRDSLTLLRRYLFSRKMSVCKFVHIYRMAIYLDVLCNTEKG